MSASSSYCFGIPSYHSLSSVYDDDDDVASYETKYKELEDMFQTTYNSKKPDFYIRAPGRVNLIGEHIDYEGYSVLPMAIGREVIMAVSVVVSGGDDNISLTNVNSSKFTSTTIPIDPETDITGPLHWSHYFQCGYKGAWLLAPGEDNSDNNKNEKKSGIGMNVLVDGNIPLASGLSSSSALVVASTIATLMARQQLSSSSSSSPVASLSASQLADICRQAEGYIGTMGGGMDQAISILAQKGYVRIIHFDTDSGVQTEPVKLPSGIAIIVADSLTTSEKAKTARLLYNKRVVECMLGSKKIAKCHGIQNWRDMSTLKQVQKQCNKSLKNMEVLVDQYLDEVDTSQSLCDYFSVQKLTEVFPKNDQKINLIQDVIKSTTEYKLHSRAKHVYSEADRVYQFQQICKEAAASIATAAENSNDIDSYEYIHDLGSLMNASHTSCKELYECSCDELDVLTKTCRKLGALGSRLTGAGWGGSAVSLVLDHQVETFIHHLKVEYYGYDWIHNNQNQDGGGDDDNSQGEVVFACKPMTGASILKF